MLMMQHASNHNGRRAPKNKWMPTPSRNPVVTRLVSPTHTDASSALTCAACATTAPALSKKWASVSVSLVTAPGLNPSSKNSCDQWLSSQPTPRRHALRCGKHCLQVNACMHPPGRGVLTKKVCANAQ